MDDNGDVAEKLQVKSYTDNMEGFNNKRRIIKYIILLVIILVIVDLIILLVTLLKGKNKNSENIEEKIPAIFDVDEGGDDMIAFMLAYVSKKFDILGITTVTPDHIIDDVTNVWLRFLEYMNFNAKVYKGEDHPLVRNTTQGTFFHDYQIEFPSTNKTAENISAVDFMINTIKNSKKKVTLFLLGPLTNFAKAFQQDKSIINNIEEIIIMGGTKEFGNMRMNPKAEYNIYQDSEAANIVFNCGIKVKVFGTDVTHKTEFSDEIYEKYYNWNTSTSYFAYCAMKGTFETWGDNYVHDPVTVIYYMNRDIVQLKEYYSYVDTNNPDVNGTNYGTMEFFEPNNENKSNIYYSESINLELYWKTFDSLVSKKY
jgi:inosine-uridine nucleoside N-ribohydrolase